VVQEESNKIYFVICGHLYKYLRILEVCTIFCELNELKNDLKSSHSAVPKISPRLQCQLGGLPCVAGWAMAWRPGTASEAVRVLCARRARCGVVTKCGTVHWRARRWPNCGGGPHGVGDVSSKESGGGAHRGGGVTTGQRGSSVRRRAAASSLEGGSAVTPGSSGSYGGV
jgi:hypothetical protein